MICWSGARETTILTEKRLIARYFQYRLDRSVHEKFILTLTKNFAWYFQYRMWFVDLVHETYSHRTKKFVWYFQYRLWFADLMREKLLILSDLLILCRRNLFWQNKGIRLIVLTYIMICSCMNNLFTEQRASLDTFQYIAICCERNLFWQNKDFAWYLSICCGLLYEKLMYLTRW